LGLEVIIRIILSEDFTIEATSFDQSGKIEYEKINNSINMIRNYINR